MTAATSTAASCYPGETAKPEELIALAAQFQNAAKEASRIWIRGQNTTAAPFRLLSIHAIELYLNAFLLHCGEPAPAIRGMQHNLAARVALLDKHKLVLRTKTRAHLSDISLNREYLVSRYAPDVTTLSQINRLQATLIEVESKVRAKLAPPPPAKSAKVGPKAPAPVRSPQPPRQLDLLTRPSGAKLRWRLAQ
jgi:hypothetical protein